MNKREILVVGYPRSGNSWLSRLIGDALNSPVTGWGNAKPLAEEGANRPGIYVVRQLHLKALAKDPGIFLPDAWTVYMPRQTDEIVIHVYRDPRDVAISAMFYFDKTLDEMLDAMLNGKWPVEKHGSWQSWFTAWAEQKGVTHISYEQLLANPVKELTQLLTINRIGFDPRMVEQAVERQAFDKKREHIKQHGANYNYGREAQLKALRKGIAGDWRNHFKRHHGKYMHGIIGDLLGEFGFEDDPDWWKELPKE